MADALDKAFNVYPAAGSTTPKFARVDFRTTSDTATEFEELIETKCPRLGWARATICSCKGFSDQTDQTDPDCPACNALGWRFFRPKEYVVDEDTLGPLDALQAAILEKAKAVVIRGLTTGIGVQPDIFQTLGKWALGSTLLTVRPNNRVGYFDRIIQLDVVEPFSEVIDTDGSSVIQTRYPVHSLNFIASLAAEFGDDEITLFDDGTLGWKAGSIPEAGTRITIHYMHHPVWVVMEFVNANRTSLVKFKKNVVETPAGDTQHLPVRVMLRREYLPADPA